MLNLYKHIVHPKQLYLLYSIGSVYIEDILCLSVCLSVCVHVPFLQDQSTTLQHYNTTTLQQLHNTTTLQHYRFKLVQTGSIWFKLVQTCSN